MPRYIQDPETLELIEIDPNYVPERKAPAVFGDLPGYQSPVSGLWIDGRRARRDDLRRHNCRPWEGMTQERKEADRRRKYQEEKLDRGLEEAARKAFQQMDAPKRKVLEGS